MLLNWGKDLQNQWSNGHFQQDTPQKTFAANAQALGQIRVLGDLYELDYERFKEVLERDDE